MLAVEKKENSVLMVEEEDYEILREIINLSNKSKWILRGVIYGLNVCDNRENEKQNG